MPSNGKSFQRRKPQLSMRYQFKGGSKNRASNVYSAFRVDSSCLIVCCRSGERHCFLPQPINRQSQAPRIEPSARGVSPPEYLTAST